MRAMSRAPLRLAGLAVSALVLTAVGARADAIDGEWCREGRSFKIEGPRIRTYAGSSLNGLYDRHRFEYTAPASEPEAGAVIVMQLRGKEEVHLYRKPKEGGACDQPPEIWRRCRVTS